MKTLTLITLLMGLDPSLSYAADVPVKTERPAIEQKTDKEAAPEIKIVPFPFTDLKCFTAKHFAEIGKQFKFKMLAFGDNYMDGGPMFILKFDDGSVNFYRATTDGSAICYLGGASNLEIDKAAEMWDGSGTEG